MFDTTVDAKGTKTKDLEVTVRAFLSMITEQNRPKNFWISKGFEFDGE